MTTNRMGLEQTLSDGELTVITDTDHVQCGDAAAMARELLAYRKASKKAVAWTDAEELRDLERDGYAAMLSMKNQDKNTDPRRQIMLYAAPPLPAGTVPDDPTDDERLMEIEGISVVKLPSEFHSEHGVVVQLEKVMAALAVHGIKYERWHQKVVGLRAGIDAVRAADIEVDVDKINAKSVTNEP
ncbi:hypothetical protein [Buttiauxella izardii]|uniref:Uncharacterized protein n=1 Tax=Buttiauxella izardii TaxID=82991 RepID=A0A3A5K204_9ENTR|nr:hypothetical protein [Buttiauxella izardii]RJT26882.1 hypothetical protein D6029_03595 [Buttiauxella izardii]